MTESTLARFQGTSGAIQMAGFLLVLVGGIVTLLSGLSHFTNNEFVARGTLLVGLSILAFLAAGFVWRNEVEAGGLVAIATAIGLLLMPLETAGILALVGGILSLVSERFEGSGTRGQRPA